MHFTLDTAAVHWCLVTAHLYADWICTGVNTKAQGCCYLLLYSSTDQQGIHFALITQDILNNSVSTLSLTVSLRVTCSGKNPGNTQADSQGPIESTVELGTSVRDNDIRKALTA